MVSTKPKIGISLRVVEAPNYHEKRDALSQDWPAFLEKLHFNPIFIPNTMSDITSYLQDMQIDGLILSGGDNIGDTPERDKTEKHLIEYAVNNKIPLIGICRGMQIINDYFGGTIEKSNNVKHVGKPHNVEITNKEFSSFLNATSLQVNSFHHNLIHPQNLGHDLEPFAVVKEDDTVEGFFHKKYLFLGVMWHPERDQNNQNQLLLKKAFQTILTES